MELKQSKPMHFRCPKCGFDFSTNTNKIVDRKQELQLKRTMIVNKLREFDGMKNKKRMPEYQRLVAKQNDIDMQLQAINRLNRNLSENAEIEQFKIFKNLVKAEIGQQKTINLLKEAEDCMLYRDYDTAIQKYNRFDGV